MVVREIPVALETVETPVRVWNRPMLHKPHPASPQFLVHHRQSQSIELILDRCYHRGHPCAPTPFPRPSRQLYQDQSDCSSYFVTATKRGAIPAHVAPILERLHVGGESWLKMMVKFHRLFKSAAGRPKAMQQEREQRGTRSIHGIRNSRTIFS